MPDLAPRGDEDLNTPPDAASVLAREIPEAAMVVIPGASHMVPMEAAELFNEQLVRFLRTVET